MKYVMKFFLIIAIFGLLLTPGIFQSSQSQEFDSSFSFDYPADRDDAFNMAKSVASSEGSIRLIIELEIPPFGDDLNDPSNLEGLQAAIRSAQQSVFDEIRGVADKDETSYFFESIPFLVIEANIDDIDKLIEIPTVLSITEDVAEPPLLKDSTVRIGADNAWSNGFSGQNQTVAILDSGVDGTHPFLAGKIVSEACFSTTQGTTSTTLCPNGLPSQIGVGAGANCSSIRGCDHGTHVAGIAAGGEFFSGPVKYSGVAKDADIIAIQVFSKFNNPSDCAGVAPCILSYRSDQMKAMERVFDLRNDFDIASVNLSLGGGKFASSCDTDPRKTVIDNLRSVNTATVIASGNNGFSDGIGTPACISTAISVGSTTNSDVVSSFSNSADILDLLAPGDSIRSSVPGGSLSFKGGTSMATPHVAGAWAVMKSKAPTASVSEVLQTLKDTGVDVTDSRNGLTFKRIQLDTAVFTIPEFYLAPLILLVAITSVLIIFMGKNQKIVFR